MDLIAGRPASAAEFRAARALLDWSLMDAARRAHVSISAVLRCERHDGGRAQGPDVHALMGAYITAGVRFLPGGVAGVELSAVHAAEAGVD